MALCWEHQTLSELAPPVNQNQACVMSVECNAVDGFSPMSGNSPGMSVHLGDQTACLSSGENVTYANVDGSPNRSTESPLPLSKLRLFVVVYKVPMHTLITCWMSIYREFLKKCWQDCFVSSQEWNTAISKKTRRPIDQKWPSAMSVRFDLWV